MNRKRLLARLDIRWQAFNRSFEGLADPAMMEAGVTGEWSVRDLLTHVTTWEREAILALPLIVDGKRPHRYGDIDRFNAEQQALKLGVSLPAVRRELEETHARLLAYLATVPDEALEGETRSHHRLRLDTYGHYPQHTEAILAWRLARGL